jgi:transcriptional regulator with XRE-family HTH domain
MVTSTVIRRIPEDELAELWFGFRQHTMDKLQVAFRRHGIPEKEIAVRLGKDPATISRCLKGRSNMTLRTMHELARGMNCRLRVELDYLPEIVPVNRERGEPWRPPQKTGGTANTNSNKITISGA